MGEALGMAGVSVEGGGVFEVLDVQRPLPGLVVHRGRLLEGEAESERALLYLSGGRNADALQSLIRSHRILSSLQARREVADLDDDISGGQCGEIEGLPHDIAVDEEVLAKLLLRAVAQLLQQGAGLCGREGQDRGRRWRLVLAYQAW